MFIVLSTFWNLKPDNLSHMKHCHARNEQLHGQWLQLKKLIWGLMYSVGILSSGSLVALPQASGSASDHAIHHVASVSNLQVLHCLKGQVNEIVINSFKAALRRNCNIEFN